MNMLLLELLTPVLHILANLLSQTIFFLKKEKGLNLKPSIDALRHLKTVKTTKLNPVLSQNSSLPLNDLITALLLLTAVLNLNTYGPL